MKHLLLLLSLVLLPLCAIHAQGKGQKSTDVVEVIYFHGKQRCPGCMAIEKFSRELVNTAFSKEQQAGRVRFRVVDINSEQGAVEARKYKVTWSSLFVTAWKNGKQTRKDLTRFGFQYARKDTPKFKQGLKQEINKHLR